MDPLSNKPKRDAIWNLIFWAWCALIVFAFGALGGLTYIAHHFITKFW
jgi:hypothetical protein